VADTISHRTTTTRPAQPDHLAAGDRALPLPNDVNCRHQFPPLGPVESIHGCSHCPWPDIARITPSVGTNRRHCGSGWSSSLLASD
jgi:hypothetical protein